MPRHLMIVSLVYLVLVLQPSLGNGWTQHLARPWLPGIVIVFCLSITPGPSGLIWSSVLGLGVDCLSGNKLGINLIAATISALSVFPLQSQARPRGVITFGLMTLWATFVWRCLTTFGQSSLESRPIDVLPGFIAAACEGIASSGILIVILITSRTLTNSTRSRSITRVTLNNQWSMLTGE